VKNPTPTVPLVVHTVCVKRSATPTQNIAVVKRVQLQLHLKLYVTLFVLLKRVAPLYPLAAAQTAIAIAMQTILKKDSAMKVTHFVILLVLLMTAFTRIIAMMRVSIAALLQAQVQLQKQLHPKLHVTLFAWGKMMVLLYLKAAVRTRIVFVQQTTLKKSPAQNLTGSVTTIMVLVGACILDSATQSLMNVVLDHLQRIIKKKNHAAVMDKVLRFGQVNPTRETRNSQEYQPPQ
jgi:hypothetical protein